MNKPLDLTKPMQTRDGRPATLLASDLNARRPLVIRYSLKDGSGEECVCTRYADGSINQNGIVSEADIINVPEKHILYVNIYPRSDTSRAEADAAAASHRIACIRIEYTEGQFDD